jgi:hypothetical protein
MMSGDVWRKVKHNNKKIKSIIRKNIPGLRFHPNQDISGNLVVDGSRVRFSLSDSFIRIIERSVQDKKRTKGRRLNV